MKGLHCKIPIQIPIIRLKNHNDYWQNSVRKLSSTDTSVKIRPKPTLPRPLNGNLSSFIDLLHSFG